MSVFNAFYKVSLKIEKFKRLVLGSSDNWNMPITWVLSALYGCGVFKAFHCFYVFVSLNIEDSEGAIPGSTDDQVFIKLVHAIYWALMAWDFDLVLL